MITELSPEKLNALVDFLNEKENAPFDADTAAALLSAAATLGRRLIKENRRISGENAALRRRLERISEKNVKDKALSVENDWFESTGLDSVEVGKAFLYCLQQGKFMLSKDKFWSLLFMLYASFLFHVGKTLFLEHPAVIIVDRDGKEEAGIRFWRMKELSVVNPVPHEAWSSLAAKDPRVAKYISGYALKYGNYSEADLKKYTERSAPVKDAVDSARRIGRKSTTLSDKDIYLWKENEKH